MYNQGTKEMRKEFVKEVKQNLELNKRGLENIGIGLDKDMVRAGEIFLRIIKK